MKRTSSNRQQSIARAAMTIVLVVVAVVFSCLLRGLPQVQALELGLYTTLIRSHHVPSIDDQSTSPITIIEITEEDIQALGRYPISDGDMASLLETVLQYEPAAIGLDIFRDVKSYEGRERLVDVLRKNEMIIVVDQLDAIGPPPEIKDQRHRIGFSDLVLDSDSVVRRNLLSAWSDELDSEVPSFGYVIAAQYLSLRNIDLEEVVLNNLPRFEGDHGGYSGEDDGGYTILLDFKDGEAFQVRTLQEVLDGKLTEDLVKDRIVLIGVPAISMKDWVDTAAKVEDFGVVVHARCIDQLIRAATIDDRPVGHVGQWMEILWFVLWALVASVIPLLIRQTWQIAGMTAGGVVGLWVITNVVFAAGIWLPVVPTILCWLIAMGGQMAAKTVWERRMRLVTRQLANMFLADRIVDELWDQRDQLIADGKIKAEIETVTMLFTDMRGFSAISEKIEPDVLISWLNAYMETMAKVVDEHDGVVNDYIGDAIMALFGAPVLHHDEDANRRDAQNAVRCALAMRSTLRQLNEDWLNDSKLVPMFAPNPVPSVQMRIGIYTGPVAVGVLGGSGRLKYTVIGNNVNIAARLESHAKDDDFGDDVCADGCRILIGQSTQDWLDSSFDTRPVGEMTVRNIEQPIQVYGVVNKPDGS